MKVRFSMYVAFLGGVLLPILETIRRWSQLTDPHYFMSWFDDYLIGGFLCFGAWKTYKSTAYGHKYLAAAWGFATGMAFYSFFGHLYMISASDPSGVSSVTVVTVKGVMLFVCMICMVFTLTHKTHNTP